MHQAKFTAHLQISIKLLEQICLCVKQTVSKFIGRALLQRSLTKGFNGGHRNSCCYLSLRLFALWCVNRLCLHIKLCQSPHHCRCGVLSVSG